MSFLGSVGHAIGSGLKAVSKVAAPVAEIGGLVTGQPWLSAAGAGLAAVNKAVDKPKTPSAPAAAATNATRTATPGAAYQPSPAVQAATTGANATAPTATMPYGTSGAPVTPPAPTRTDTGGVGGDGTYSAGSNLIGATVLPNDASTQRADGLAGQAVAAVNGVAPLAQRTIAGTNVAGAGALNDEAAGLVRGASITPQGAIAGTDLSHARGLAADALGDVNAARIGDNYGTVAAQDYHASPEQLLARRLQAEAIQKTANGPDRTALAQQALALFNQQNDETFGLEQKQIGQKAAALGRIGKQGVSTDYGNLELARERNRNQKATELALDAAGQTLDDRLKVSSATQANTGTLGSEDRANYASEQSGRDEARRERTDQVGIDTTRANLALARGGAKTGLADQEAGFAKTTRADAESDRDFGLKQSSTIADLALQKAGALGQSSDRALNIAGTTRHDAESDREYATGVDKSNQQLGLDKASAYRQLGNDAETTGANRRGEVRDERTYQAGQSQTAIDNAVRQHQLEQGDRVTDANIGATAAGVGYGGNPGEAQIGVGAGQSAGADQGMNDVAGIIAEILRRRNANGATPGTVTLPTTTPPGRRVGNPVLIDGSYG